jgi:hypothetical protein
MSANSWSLSNRRQLDALELLCHMAGTRVDSKTLEASLSGSNPTELSQEQRAVALAFAGQLAVSMAIDIASGLSRPSSRLRRQVLRAMDMERGARAAVFVAYGLCAIAARLASSPTHPLNLEPQRAARHLLNEAFPLDDETARPIDEIARKIDPHLPEEYLNAFISLAFHAIAAIIGEEKTRQMPGFAELEGSLSNSRIAQLGWEGWASSAIDLWIKVSAPDDA